MTRKRWAIVVVLGLLLVGLVGGGIAGYFFLRGYRGHRSFVRAEEAYSKGLWAAAKNNYTWYLIRHPEDKAAMRKYIAAALKLPEGRASTLRDAGRAYMQLVLSAPEDHALLKEAVDFYTKHRLWHELDYVVGMLVPKFPDDAFLRYNKALANDHNGQANDAIDAYQKLIEAKTAPPETYGNLAALLRRQGLLEQGRETLEKAVADQPEEARIRVDYARFLLAANDVEHASIQLDAALAKGGETADALLLAAQVNAAKSDWKSAQTFADKALNVSPDPQAYAIRVNAFLVDHQMAKAIEMLSGLDPLFLADNPELYLLLAELQIDAGAQKDAEHTIAAYRDAYPNDRDVFEYLAARGLLKKGAVADAIAKLETVVSQMPDFSRARFYLGLAYLDRGDKDRAKNTFEIYLKNNPEDERARAIWDAAFADRSPEQVEGAAAKLLENDTAYSGSLFMAAYSLMKTKPGVEGSADHLELAKKLLEKAIERSPSEPQGYRDLLFLYLGRKDLENARQVLARAESAGLSSSTLNLLRAGMALAEDQPAQAKESFQRELEAGAMASAKALEWAGLFSDMGQADMSLEMLAAAQARANTDEDRRELELAPIGLCVKSGDLDKALAFIDQVGAKYATLPDVIRRLDDQRIALARIWLAPGERRNVAKASRLVADIAKAEPDRVDAKTLQVRLLLQQAPPDVDAAETLCASLRKPDKPDPELLVLASDIASQKAQFAKALDFATQANNAAPDEFNIQMTLARAQIQMDLYADAVATLEKMRSRDPGNRSVLESLARAYAGAKRFEEADALIKQLAAGGDAGAVDSLRASVLASRGQWAPAEQLLRKRYEADPNDYATIRALGRTLFSSGQKDRAVAFLKECNDRQPDNPELWVELGNAYLAMGDAPNRSEASLAFSRALVQQPGYAPALQGMLDVQLRADNLGGALGLCDRFLAATPDNADMLQQKALLLARLPDRRKEALETIQKAIDIAKRPEFIFLRGSLYLSQNEFAKALEDFLQVSQARKTRSAELECLMAETYLGLNDPSLARFYCNSAKDKAAKGERVDSIRMERLASRIEKAMHQ